MAPKGASRRPLPPKPPDGWTRCHAYMAKKSRFCRQQISNGVHCGNHAHLANNDETAAGFFASDRCHPTTTATTAKTGRVVKRKRIQCPVDPTHYIFEDSVEVHVKKCPKTVAQQLQQRQCFYNQNCNCGGHGALWSAGGKQQQQQPRQNHIVFATVGNNDNTGGVLSSGSNETTRRLEWAKRVALRVLQVHQTLFCLEPPQPSQNNNTNTLGRTTTSDDLLRLTTRDIATALPLVDLAQAELDAGLTESLNDHRIKSGGPRHIYQQASLIGHLKRVGILLQPQEQPRGQTSESPSNAKSSSSSLNDSPLPSKDTIILELGAGRGMTGLVVAGVAAAASGGRATTHLTMIERGTSRGRAEKFLRKIQAFPEMFPTQSTYLNLGHVQWDRVQCDLAHVNMKDVLQSRRNGTSREDQQVVVIAKHLCGVGTDLALKSLEPIRDQISACIMSTCCHGVCAWEDYVGRLHLNECMVSGADETELHSFGAPEFELLRHWSAGTVMDDAEDVDAKDGANVPKSQKDASTDVDEDVDDDHPPVPTATNPDRNGHAIGVTKIVEALNLSCGQKGLGRACQRLLDYGRREYLRREIFCTPSQENKSEQKESLVELLYSTPDSITPQNAVLIAHR